ncbi:MAG: arginine decarboxylase, partial [Bacteroidales bacterium]|nr:arginine decarboxylase [Bacteroidales bacterium]
ADYHANAIFLPTIRSRRENLYIGFFHTGAYQEALSGFGGIKHCLMPSPRHILIDRDKEGNLITSVFSEEQTAESMLKVLGYK